MPLYEYKCKECGEQFEAVNLIKERRDQRCGCGGSCDMIEGLSRPPIKFPEGVFVGLPGEPHITSRRQLREEVKKAGNDEHTECYSKLDDGIGGY